MSETGARSEGVATDTGRVKKIKDLADVLLEEGLITADQLKRATAEQERLGRTLGRVLIDLGMVKETDLVAALARQVGLDYIDLGEHQIDPAAASLVSEQVARRYRAMPIGFEDSRLVVATAADIEAAIRKYGQFEQSVEDMATEASSAAAEGVQDLEQVEAAVED